MKTYLRVSLEDRFRVKNLGARWDPARKAWYVPDALDLTPFLPWVPGLPALDKKVVRVLGRKDPRRFRRDQ